MPEHNSANVLIFARAFSPVASGDTGAWIRDRANQGPGEGKFETRLSRTDGLAGLFFNASIASKI